MPIQEKEGEKRGFTKLIYNCDQQSSEKKKKGVVSKREERGEDGALPTFLLFQQLKVMEGRGKRGGSCAHSFYMIFFWKKKCDFGGGGGESLGLTVHSSNCLRQEKGKKGEGKPSLF